MENDGVSVVAGFHQHASHDRDKPALFDTITGAVLIYVLTDQLQHFTTFPCAQHAKVVFSGTIINKIPTISCAAYEMDRSFRSFFDIALVHDNTACWRAMIDKMPFY